MSNERPNFGKLNLHSKNRWTHKDNGGFGIAPHRVMASPVLSPGEKLVFYALFNHIRNQGRGLCCPCVETLAEQTGMDARHVRRCLQALKDAYLIEWVRGQRCCYYKLTDPDELRTIRRAYVEGLKKVKVQASGDK